MDKQAVDEIKQHFGIVAEGLESKIELIAEGHALLRSEMKSSIGEVKTEVRDLRSEVDVVRSEVGGLRAEVGELKSDVGSFRTEVKQDFSDVRSMIKLSYAEIDTRIGNLERDLADLKARVERVEAAVR